MQIVEGLAFLHNDVKLIEGNITPSNIILTKDGHWKLAGFNFSTPAEVLVSLHLHICDSIIQLCF